MQRLAVLVRHVLQAVVLTNGPFVSDALLFSTSSEEYALRGTFFQGLICNHGGPHGGCRLTAPKRQLLGLLSYHPARSTQLAPGRLISSVAGPAIKRLKGRPRCLHSRSAYDPSEHVTQRTRDPSEHSALAKEGRAGGGASFEEMRARETTPYAKARTRMF